MVLYQPFHQNVSKKGQQWMIVNESWTPKTNHKRSLWCDKFILINEKLYRMISTCQDPYSLSWISQSGYKQSKVETESIIVRGVFLLLFGWVLLLVFLNKNVAIWTCSSHPSQLLVFSCRAALGCWASQRMAWQPALLCQQGKVYIF